MSEFASRAKATWARLIRKVYEADPPLESPDLAGERRPLVMGAGRA